MSFYFANFGATASATWPCLCGVGCRTRLLEALQDANIPVAPGGRTALFLAPDAQLFGRTFAWLADTSWREQAWGYGQNDTLDAVIQQYTAKFGLGARNTSALRRLLVKWKEEVEAPKRPINLVRSYYELLATCTVADWDLADPVQVTRSAPSPDARRSSQTTKACASDHGLISRHPAT